MPALACALMLLPQTLFSLRAAGELGEPFTIYVEEPEIHLHPTAERAIVEVLAYLVNSGFRSNGVTVNSSVVQ